MAWADHFSRQAAAYRDFRPRYPADLAEYLARLAPRQERAWDAGTGNGQAALALAEHFAVVVATDPSARQVFAAAPHPRVWYALATAEAPPLAPASVDLVAVAQAVHWFDFDRFYAQVRRVLHPGGVLAVWCYRLAFVTPAIDRVLHPFWEDPLGPYWPPGREWVDDEYRRLPFPFAEEPTPAFAITATWTLSQLLGYLGTWSAVERYRRATGREAVAELAPRLAAAWGDPGTARTVRFPLALRVGRLTAA